MMGRMKQLLSRFAIPAAAGISAKDSFTAWSMANPNYLLFLMAATEPMVGLRQQQLSRGHCGLSDMEQMVESVVSNGSR